MSQLNQRSDSNNCFICGPDNPVGLQIQFRMDGDLCKAEYTPQADHCGYAGVTHGGIIFSLLDDVMANWLYLQGELAYTGKCEIRYRNPAPVGTRLLLESSLIKRKGRTAWLQGSAQSANGELYAEATATFAVIGDKPENP